MKQLCLLITLAVCGLTAQGQEHKNEISAMFGYTLPLADHANEYANPGFYNYFAYKRSLNEQWRLTIGAYTARMQFDQSAFRNDLNLTAVPAVSGVDSKSWAVTSLNLGAEWTFYQGLYLLAGLNIYTATYPELTLYLADGSIVDASASKGSGVGINAGLGYAIPLGSNNRWEIPIQLSVHLGSLDYQDFIFTERNSSNQFTDPGFTLNYVAFNAGAGIAYRF